MTAGPDEPTGRDGREPQDITPEDAAALAEGGVFGEEITAGFRNLFEGTPIHASRTAFQELEIWETDAFGRVLVLDGFVQTTERDEYCYHEMLVHPVLCARDHVERVLVIGGGDGGTLRRVLQHAPGAAVMCEIDAEVTRLCREYLPSVAAGAFDDERATVTFEDGMAYVDRHHDLFDAIVVDSTDPVGAAVVLFSPEFYAACRKALRPDGVLVSQTGSPFYQGAELQMAIRNMRTAFDVAEVYQGFVPTYPGVLWSFTCATNATPPSAASQADVARRLDERGIETRFYRPQVHEAAFGLPAFVRELVDDALR